MREGGWMGRSFLFAVFCCAIALFTGAANAQSTSSKQKCQEILIAQEKPTVNPPTTQSPERAQNPPVTEAKTETEQYTLSHERYEKAVAYSRAGYILYFIWIALGLVVVWLFLRLGIAARIRDFSLLAGNLPRRIAAL